MGGKGSTTTGQLPPEVRGLFQSSSSELQRSQRMNPVTGYLDRYPEEVAPLSPSERYAGGQAYQLFNTPGVDALALQDILSLPDLAAAGPTTGYYEPSNLDLRYYMDFLEGPQYGELGPEADYSAPSQLGPDVRSLDDNPRYPPTPPGGKPRPIIQPTPGDPGGRTPPGDGGGIEPNSAASSVPPHVADPRGFWSDTQGPPNQRGTIGTNHTVVQFGPDGYISAILSDPLTGETPEGVMGDPIPYDPWGAAGGASPASVQPMASSTTPSLGGEELPPITQEQFMSTQPAGGYGAATLSPSSATSGMSLAAALDGGREPTDFSQFLGGSPDRMPITPVDRNPGPGTRPPPITVPPRPPTQDDIASNLLDSVNNSGRPPATPPTSGSFGGAAYQQAINKVQNAGTGRLTGETPFYQSPGIQSASQRARGEGLLARPLQGGFTQVGGNQVRDPAVRSALEAFRLGVEPGMVNQYTLSGLGRSTALPAAMAVAQSQMLTPLLTDALGREERDIERRTGAVESELARRERSSVRRSEATAQRIGQLLNLSSMGTQRRQGAIETTMNVGGVERGVAQNQRTSAYNDMLRRQGLAESATLGPFGQLLPGAFGSRTVGK